jgi:hypothetical protein
MQPRTAQSFTSVTIDPVTELSDATLRDSIANTGDIVGRRFVLQRQQHTQPPRLLSAPILPHTIHLAAVSMYLPHSPNLPTTLTPTQVRHATALHKLISSTMAVADPERYDHALAILISALTTPPPAPVARDPGQYAAYVRVSCSYDDNLANQVLDIRQWLTRQGLPEPRWWFAEEAGTIGTGYRSMPEMGELVQAIREHQLDGWTLMVELVREHDIRLLVLNPHIDTDISGGWDRIDEERRDAVSYSVR